MKNLILLHGAAGCAEQFEHLRKLLSDDFRVFAFDFSGHGGRAFEADFGIEKFAGELADFIQKERIENPYIFGYSMGGYVALKAAAAALIQPQAMVTLATKMDWTPESAAQNARMLNAEKIKEKVPAFAEMLARRHGNDWELLLQKTASMMLDMGELPAVLPADLKKINCPVKMTVGDRDNVVSTAETVEASRHLPEGSYEIIENLEHPFEKVDVKLLSVLLRSFFGV